MDSSPPGPCVHGILQVRILKEGVVISSSRGSCQSRHGTQVSCIAGILFIIWATREALWIHRGLKKKKKAHPGTKTKQKCLGVSPDFSILANWNQLENTLIRSGCFQESESRGHSLYSSDHPAASGPRVRPSHTQGWLWIPDEEC